ncbi:hypothetical protein [Okeania sp.]|nr:hypothetical protein [Okeania sp.]MEB3340464.1 hypothetical protein [Okeania sp.]
MPKDFFSISLLQPFERYLKKEKGWIERFKDLPKDFFPISLLQQTQDF